MSLHLYGNVHEIWLFIWKYTKGAEATVTGADVRVLVNSGKEKVSQVVPWFDICQSVSVSGCYSCGHIIFIKSNHMLSLLPQFPVI